MRRFAKRCAGAGRKGGGGEGEGEWRGRRGLWGEEGGEGGGLGGEGGELIRGDGEEVGEFGAGVSVHCYHYSPDLLGLIQTWC